MEITAIIQARMGSTRLPGKVLRNVAGRPLLDYLFHQVSAATEINSVILATSVDTIDDPLEEYATRRGIDVYRGAADDVLSRYCDAATCYGAKHIMRLTGDCPLLDPHTCDRVAREYRTRQYDYVLTGPDFPEGQGAEVFSFDSLKEACDKATLPSEREHVTLYFHNNSDRYTRCALSDYADNSRLRYTVDHPDDLEVISAIVAAFPSNTVFSGREVNSFLQSHPEISALNARIARHEGLFKSLAEDPDTGPVDYGTDYFDH
jgi:spore coat polysaccharide biosynthesis protein SpsF